MLERLEQQQAKERDVDTLIDRRNNEDIIWRENEIALLLFTPAIGRFLAADVIFYD
jgi:hypothetical protein